MAKKPSKIFIKNKVSELPNALKELIPIGLEDIEVSYAKDYGKTKTGSGVIELLNGRFIFKQLGLELQDTDYRESYYAIRQGLDGKLDIAGNSDQQYNSLTGNMVEGYFKKLANFLGYKYWGYCMDYIQVYSQGIAVIYDLNMETTTLTSENIKNFISTPFFLIICEKEAIIKATMKEMIKRGYNAGFYGISLSRFATTHTIKLLIELSKVKKFYSFIEHDLDINGLMIFFDMKRWIDCESVGVNPEFLDHIGVSFNVLSEDYSPRKAHILGANNMIDLLNVSEDEKDIYRNWVVACSNNRRAELNSLTALRLREDFSLNKARDFCDYIEESLKGKNFDLNRYKEPYLEDLYLESPSFSSPKVINELIDEIEKETTEKIRNHLGIMELDYDFKWEILFPDETEKINRNFEIFNDLLNRSNKIIKRKLKQKNKNYQDSLKLVDGHILTQERLLREEVRDKNDILDKIKTLQERFFQRIIRNTPEYKENIPKIKEFTKKILKAIEDIEL